MVIQIHNYLSGSFLLENEPDTWDSIVILDSDLTDSPFVIEHSKTSLQLNFDDVVEQKANKILPKPNHVKLALDFGIQSEKLLVCFRAGQSRSAAIAFAVAFEKLGADGAVDILNPKRHSPNYHIIKLAAKIVSRHGLLDVYDQWGMNIGDVRLTDCLDEIENEYDVLEASGAQDRISKSTKIQ